MALLDAGAVGCIVDGWRYYGSVVGGAGCWCSIVVSLMTWYVASWRYCAAAGCLCSHDGVVGGALRVALSVAGALVRSL